MDVLMKNGKLAHIGKILLFMDRMDRSDGTIVCPQLVRKYMFVQGYS